MQPPDVDLTPAYDPASTVTVADQRFGIRDQFPFEHVYSPFDPYPVQEPSQAAIGQSVRIAAPDFSREYVAGTAQYGYDTPDTVLSRIASSLEKMRGPWVFDVIGMDPKVASCLRVLKQGVVANGITVEPRHVAVPGDEEIEAEVQSSIDEAKEAYDFIMEGVNQLPRKLIAWAFEMLDHSQYGHKLSEVIYEEPRNTPGDRWDMKSPLKELKVKRRRSYRFVIDHYWNVTGALCATAQPMEPVVLPMSKFSLLTNDSREGDPRGRSVCTEIDMAWFHKVSAIPEHGKYLKQHASAKLWGALPPESGFEADENPATGQPDGTKLPISAAEAMNQKLAQFHNGTTMVVPNGATVNAVPPQGDGTPFLKTYDWADGQIASGILQASRAVQEAKHSSKADGEIAQDVSGLVVLWNKVMMRACIETVFWYNLAFNFGVKYATKNCPKALLGETEHQDFSAVALAVASTFTAGYLAPNQLPYTDNKLGLPPGKRSDDQIARLSAPGRQAPESLPGQPGSPGRNADPNADAKPDKGEK